MVRVVRRHKYLLCYLFSLFVLGAVLYVLSTAKVNQINILSSKIIIRKDHEQKREVEQTTQTINSALSCYYSRENDSLCSTERMKNLGNNSIFFLESSCHSYINSRQACSIEAAARLHPQWNVNLLFSAPVSEETLNTGPLEKLLQFQNVNAYRLHIQEYSKDTIVERILQNKLSESTHPIEHAADILRILTLHKYGGIYLDTDAMLIKNISFLPPNWIAKQSNKEIASGAMAFTKDGVGATVTTEILREINKTFAPKLWAHNGPIAIQRVLKRHCPNIFNKTHPSGDCNGVQIYENNNFYPINYNKNKLYVKNGTIKNMEDSYLHHTWNHLTKDSKIEYDSPYAKLARKYCPTIYDMYGNLFGE